MRHTLPAIAAILAVLVAGCAHERFITDAKHPEVAVTETGIVTYRGKAIDADDLPGILKDSGLTGQDTIHIRIPSGTKDYRMPYYVMGVLVKNGFRRPVLVEDRKSSSTVKRRDQQRQTVRRPMRMQ
ncbi:MAG: hypothetical protein IKO72_14945 [Kiritimatiellae bacterium]|nr:hypothetical protein [Kiritimatiellia bacterium]